MILRFPLLALMPLALFAVPAAAQDEAPAANERINQVIVYGDDPCPTGDGDTIVVCARLDEDERYRIPPNLRSNPNDPRRESWTSRVQSMERVGRYGIQSCSPVGLGGFTGCTADMMAGFRAEQTANTRDDWTNAVEEARRRRVAGFEAAAEEEEADAVAAERAAAARAASREAAAAAADADIARGQSAESDAVEGATPLPEPGAP
jgi:hypothetical protein